MNKKEVFVKYRVSRYAHDKFRPLCDLPYGYATVEVDKVSEYNLENALIDEGELDPENFNRVEIEHYTIQK